MKKKRMIGNEVAWAASHLKTPIGIVVGVEGDECWLRLHKPTKRCPQKSGFRNHTTAKIEDLIFLCE